MSSGDVDYLHTRLKDELDRLSLSMAAAARLIGEKDSQGLRDACTGRKRVTAELVAKLAAIGVDANYVLAGQHADSQQAHQVNQNVRPYGLSADEASLLESYRSSSPDVQAAALRMLSGRAEKIANRPPISRPSAREYGPAADRGSQPRILGEKAVSPTTGKTRKKE